MCLAARDCAESARPEHEALSHYGKRPSVDRLVGARAIALPDTWRYATNVRGNSTDGEGRDATQSRSLTFTSPPVFACLGEWHFIA